MLVLLGQRRMLSEKAVDLPNKIQFLTQREIAGELVSAAVDVADTSRLGRSALRIDLYHPDFCWGTGEVGQVPYRGVRRKQSIPIEIPADLHRAIERRDRRRGNQHVIGQP